MTLDDRRDFAIRKSEVAQSMLAIFDASPVGLGFIDRDFRIVDINAVLASVSGGVPENEIGRLVADVVPGLWPQLEPMYRRVIDEDETITNVEMEGMSANDGTRIHQWLCSYHPVKSNDTVIGIGIVALDITERTHLVVCSSCREMTTDPDRAAHTTGFAEKKCGRCAAMSKMGPRRISYRNFKFLRLVLVRRLRSANAQ